MSKNVNVFITNWQNTGLTTPVDKWTVDIDIRWTDSDGVARQHVGTKTFPNILAAVPLKRMRLYMEEIILREVRLAQDIDEDID